MPGKKKVRAMPKLASSEVRNAVDLRAVLQKSSKSLLRQNKTSVIPYIQPHQSTLLTQNPLFHHYLPSPPHSRTFYTKDRPNLSLHSRKLLISSLNSPESPSSDPDQYEAYQQEMQKISLKHNYELFNEDIKSILAEKYKNKYKGKLKQALEKQSEVHRFQIETLRKFYEVKMKKYREALRKLEGSGAETVAPLIEENLSLKSQLSALRQFDPNKLTY